jgi:hypothetical protein
MNKSDPVYSVCVEMAKILVPDVCCLIMEHLEQIHIDLGRQNWQNKIRVLNNEYQEGWICIGDTGGVWRKSVLRNYHILSESHPLYGVNGNRYVCLLPENYIRAKLYKYVKDMLLPEKLA